MKTDNNHIVDFYNKFDEDSRLFFGLGQLEFARTMEIFSRHLPEPSAVIIDIGGATGVYSCALAKLGYSVHLVDPVPRHIELAEKRFEAQPDFPPAGLTVGDARKLEFADESADAVLMMGPMYHLTERDDRFAALNEAHRVLKKGGVIFTAAISRYASSLDGLDRWFVEDPAFLQIVKDDLKTGRHRNPVNHPEYFTDAYFHRPQELLEEIEKSRFKSVRVLPVQGLALVIKDFDTSWKDPKRRELILEVLRLTENEPEIRGMSTHLLGVGWK